MAARTSVGMSMLDGDKLIKQLEALAIQVREKIGQEALDAGTVSVQAAVIANAPDSKLTGSREKQSKETQRKWKGARKLKNTIKSVIRTRKKAGIAAGMMALVGPSYSDGGGHGNLFSKDHKSAVYWGVDSRQVRVVNQFVKRAADESRSAATAAVASSVKSGIDAAARATTNG